MKTSRKQLKLPELLERVLMLLFPFEDFLQALQMLEKRATFEEIVEYLEVVHLEKFQVFKKWKSQVLATLKRCPQFELDPLDGSTWVLLENPPPRVPGKRSRDSLAESDLEDEDYFFFNQPAKQQGGSRRKKKHPHGFPSLQEVSLPSSNMPSELPALLESENEFTVADSSGLDTEVDQLI